MRQGYNWWETFWKWLLTQKVGEPITVKSWLYFKKKEFEELVRDGKTEIPNPQDVVDPPNRRSE